MLSSGRCTYVSLVCSSLFNILFFLVFRSSAIVSHEFISVVNSVIRSCQIIKTGCVRFIPLLSMILLNITNSYFSWNVLSIKCSS